MLPIQDPTIPDQGAPESPLPLQIGRYRILGCLGAGGMGTVYKAQDAQLDRAVALKLPRFDGPPHDRALRAQRFQREARAAAAIRHPHVCPIHDVGEHEGHPFVVMAYIEGESLAQRLARQGPVQDLAQAVALIRQVLDALEAVHAHAIIHRDLKPSNVLLDSAGRAILTDFGLARPTEGADQLTSEGVVVGTPAYMAPEQAAGQAEAVGPWTDVYSVGVILYQMLTGRLPFEGPALTVLARIVHETPPRPSRFRQDLDAALETVVLKAMARAPQERYQSAREFSAALTAWSPALSPGAAAPTALAANNPDEVSPATEVKARAWKHRVVSAVIGRPLLLLLLIGSHLLCGLIGFMISSASSPTTASPTTATMIQEGNVRVNVGDKFEIFYPVPYATPPNIQLTWDDDPWHVIKLQEQKADRFTIQSTGGNAVWVTVHWRAEGVRQGK
jgi:serine/threonine protein kinase